MNAGRWYPTVTVLANGDVLVVSGSIDDIVGVNPVPQVFQVGSGTWRNLAELGQDLYPQMLLAPNGKVFNSGPTRDTRYLDTAGSGTWSFVAKRVGPYRDYGSAVMYAPGKVLVMGGGDPPTNTAEVIDLNQPSPTWRAVGSMAVARRQLNATLLPDGNVLVTGGTSSPGFNDPAGAVHAAELWNPTTEQWTTLASSSGIPRVYHSTAVLLPDGRVLSMGGNGDPQRNSEIYSPPYLFKGTRPTITSAPTSVAYGQSFFVETPDAAAISKVTMLRLSSVTHAFDMSQHISTLSFSQATGGLNVVAPSGGTAAPPGHYLLFILNGSGVPSVGSIVQVGGGGSGPAAPTLTFLSPSSAVAGGPAFTLTVNGSNFESVSVVRWNGANRTTTFVSATQLTAAIPAADVAAAGSASVTVANQGETVSNALTFTITGANASSTIWPTSIVPGVVDSGPDNAVQLGVKFRSDVAGTIRGIRFYKSAGNTGTHVASLWSSTGTRLATATFTNETASGWQEVSFATPVAISANTVYVASYHTTTGHYSLNSNYFSAGVDNPPLHALASAGSGGNGVYRYGNNSAAFPNKTSNAANYWVDVSFAPGSAPTLNSIAVTPGNPSINTGATQQFTATGSYSDGSTQNLTSQVTWTSSDSSVATIISGGLASGVSAGTTTITAAMPGVSGFTTLAVQAPQAPTLNSITVTPANPTIIAGATQQFTATGTYSNGSTQNITSQATWTSSSTAVATINASGLATGVSAGSATITAALSGVTGSASLTVQSPPTLSSISVTPANPTINTGATQQFTATGTYSNGSTQNITSQVTWTSSSTAVATINASGLATGASAGSTMITAGLSGVTGSTTLTVQAASLAITTTSLPNGTLNVAYSATLAASGGTLPYTWSISVGSLPPGLTLNSSSGAIGGTPTATGSYGFTVQVSDAGNAQTATRALSITVAAASSSVTIWPSTATPAFVDQGPDNPVALGVKFYSDVGGAITGIRFYKSSANTGTHVGRLWSSTGTLLATATFTGETASGWQQANFTTPVTISANTIYVASYHTSVGHYSYNPNYFSTNRDNSPLHAPLSGGSWGGNGVYAYGGSSTFPNQTYNANNYWVDVVFQ